MRGLNLLSNNRVTEILQELEDQREVPQDLRFLNRTPIVPATDEEILARYKGRVYASDILFEGGKAVVYETGKVTLETNVIPKQKHGTKIDEKMISLLSRIQRGGGLPSDEFTLKNFVSGRIDDLLLGIRQRWNALLVACKIDAFSYRRGGVIIEDSSWGRPAAMKTVPLVLWTDATNATPISDITTQLQNDNEVYGEVRNRMTLSSYLLRLIFATTEFKNKAQLYAMQTFPAGSFPLTQDLGSRTRILTTILSEAIPGGGSLVIETEDTRYWIQEADGSETSYPYLPNDVVILDNTADDNNTNAMVLGNAIVPETEASSLFNEGEFGKFTAPDYGPVAYAAMDPMMNPPDVVLFGVAKAWPILRRLGSVSIIHPV